MQRSLNVPQNTESDSGRLPAGSNSQYNLWVGSKRKQETTCSPPLERNNLYVCVNVPKNMRFCTFIDLAN